MKINRPTTVEDAAEKNEERRRKKTGENTRESDRVGCFFLLARSRCEKEMNACVDERESQRGKVAARTGQRER